MATIKTKLCRIEVPQQVLDQSDDPSLPVPELRSWSECISLPAPARKLVFRVPDASEEGCLLQIPLQDGSKISQTLPGSLKPGDMAVAFQRHGTWRLIKKPTDLAFLVPSGSKAKMAVKPQLPDGTSLHFEVPEGVQPGALIVLHHEDTWQLKEVKLLTQLQRVPNQSSTIRGPFLAALQLLSRSMSNLVPDAEGFLVVNVPFCGRFQEYAMLGNFLAEHGLTLPGVKGARIFATDSTDCYYYDWGIAQRWFAEFHPHIEVCLCVRDLQFDPLPKAAVTIALHPEVTKGGPWFPIMGSVIKASEGGICLVASFFQEEVTTIFNMVDIYDKTRQRQVVENSFWKDPANKTESPSQRMNFLLLLQPPSVARVETSIFQWFGQFMSCLCRSK